MESPSPTTERRAGLMGRLATELQRLLIAAVVVGLVLVAGKYYCFDRLDEEIRARFEGKLREHYPGLAVTVKSARRVADKGVEIRGVRIAEAGRNAPVLAEIDEIFAECDTRLPNFVTTPPHVHSLRVSRLKVRAERQAGGHWNLMRLLPLPACDGGGAPTATVHDASIEFVDATQGPSCSWTLRNIELNVSPEVAADSGQAVKLKLRGNVAGDHFEKLEFSGTLDSVSGAWDLKGAIAGLEFSPRLRAALPHELSDSLTPLASIRGRTYFSFQASREGSAAGQTRPPPARFVIQGKIAEGRIDDARLPEPLTDVEASLRFDNAGFTISDLSARCGSTRLTLNATAGGYDAASPLELSLDARQVQLDRLPVGSLPADVREAFRQFSPRGLVDVAGRLSFDGNRWTPDLAIRCHDLSIQYVEFPYRLHEGTGWIEIKPGGVAVRLRMIGGGQVVQCRADVQEPGPDFTGWIEVNSEGAIPLDDKLLAAMEAPAQRIVRAFRPRGAASFQARFHREAGEERMHRKLNVLLHECSIQHDWFAYPIDKVSGSLHLTDDDWVFRNLCGRNDSASIVGEGSWMEDARAGRLLRLQFTATDLPLAEELRQALSPEVQRLWSNLRPRGNIDHLVVGLRYTARDEQLSMDVSADKWGPGQNTEGRTLSVEPAWFRYRLDNVTGAFRYQDGVMQLSNLQATHNRTQLSGEATCRMQDGGACRLEFTRLAADRIEVDQDLVAALPSGLGESLGRVAPQGPLNMIGRLGITVPRLAEAAPELDWDLSLDLENGRIATTTPVEHIHGGVRLAGSSGRAGVACRGEISVDSAIVRGVQLTRIEGPIWTDGQRLVFGSAADNEAGQGRGQPTPRPVTADVFGGQLTLDGQVSLLEDGQFQTNASLQLADLADIARQMAPHHRGLTGNVFATAHIMGAGAGMHTWRGGGQVRLRDSDIYELPVMIALLKLLSVRRPDRTAFTTSSIDFRIEGDDLAFDRIDFSGDAITLKGKGRMNAQREIDLKFHPLMGREERLIPIMRPLLGQTGREFLLIQVTGTLDQPEVKQTVFPRLDAQLQELFPELVREELVEPAMPIMTLPQKALDRLWLLPKK